MFIANKPQTCKQRLTLDLTIVRVHIFCRNYRFQTFKPQFYKEYCLLYSKHSQTLFTCLTVLKPYRHYAIIHVTNYFSQNNLMRDYIILISHCTHIYNKYILKYLFYVIDYDMDFNLPLKLTLAQIRQTEGIIWWNSRNLTYIHLTKM